MIPTTPQQRSRVIFFSQAILVGNRGKNAPAFFLLEDGETEDQAVAAVFATANLRYDRRISRLDRVSPHRRYRYF